MTEELKRMIDEAIAKSLPAQVGDALRQRLEEADSNQIELRRTKERLETAQTTKSQLETNLAEVERKLAQHEALDGREAGVSQRERDLEIEILKIKLAAEQRVSQHGIDFLNALARNTEMRETVYRNYNRGMDYNTNLPQSVLQSESETIERKAE